jgi:putative transferase (TIGR04331 family)
MSKVYCHLTELTTTLYRHQAVLLGDWCTPRSSVRTTPHRYDISSNQLSDYQLVNQLYHELIDILSLYLSERKNSFCFSKRAVEILYGAWLKTFLICFVDRYLNILSNSDKTYICLDYDDRFACSFQSSFSSARALIDDTANQHIYQTIIRHLKLQFHQLDALQPCLNDNQLCSSGTLHSSFLNPYLHIRLLYHISSLLSRLFARTKIYRCFIAYSYLPFWSNLILALKCRSIYIPSFFHLSLSTSQEGRISPAERLRLANFLSSHLSSSPPLFNHKQCLIDLLIDFLPINLLESLSSLKLEASKLFWPSSGKPFHIITANCYQYNDLFCFVAATSVSDSNSTFSIIQHGGNFGNARFNSSEDHQRSISDYYWTWGWSEDSRTLPIGMCKRLPKYTLPLHGDLKILYVVMELDKHVYIHYGGVHSSQWIDYANFNIDALKLLKSHSYDISLRPKPRVNCWSSVHRFASLNLPFDYSRSFHASLGSYSLVISTYNAATYLETLAMNVPTLLFWDPSVWPLRDSAIPFFAELQECDIFITNSSRLVQVLDIIRSQGVASWWSSESRSKAVRNFLSRYACKLNLSFPLQLTDSFRQPPR